MRYVGRLAVAVALAAFSACSGGGDDPDAFVIPPTIDAAVTIDAAPVRGNVLNFDECADAASCTCAVTNDCNDPNSDCVPISIFTGMPKRCIPRCTSDMQDTQCPFNSVCYPASAGPMASHCFYSFCGETFSNGTTGGNCQLGGELGLDAQYQYPGYCYSFIDGMYGLCLEAGDVAVGGTCDFSVQTRTGNNCNQTSLCIGQTGAATGTCAALCDPRNINLADSTGDTCAAGSGCQDSSSHDASDIGTLGFCSPGETACSLVATTNICPNNAAGQKQGCAPTNSVRATGLCDANWGGDLAVGATTCNPTATTDPTQCAFGADCLNNTGANKCEKYCDSAASVVDCTTVMAGFTCQPFNLTATDPTLEWGTCR